jgi:hypothetical protein
MRDRFDWLGLESRLHMTDRLTPTAIFPGVVGVERSDEERQVATNGSCKQSLI